MPQGFSEDEQGAIVGQLFEVGEQLFSDHDFKKVSVDEIVARVGISKGAFYSFFESKESFFFELTQHVEAREKEAIERRLADRWETLGARELLEQFFREQFDLLLRIPLVERAIDPALFTRVVRKVGKERYEQSMKADERFWSAWTARFVERGMTAEPAAQQRAFGTLRSLFYLTLHRQEIGPGWRDTVSYLISLIARDLTEAGNA
jgi:AcrR family transcriptional regulator